MLIEVSCDVVMDILVTGHPSECPVTLHGEAFQFILESNLTSAIVESYVMANYGEIDEYYLRDAEFCDRLLFLNEPIHNC